MKIILLLVKIKNDKEIIVKILGKCFKWMVYIGRIPTEPEHKRVEQPMPNAYTATLRRKYIR